MASSSSAAAPPQQLFWPPPAAFTSNAAPPQFWPPPQLNGTAADRYFSAQKEQNAPYTRRRAALVSRAVQAMGTRWWPYQLKEAGAHTLLHGAGEYIAYDIFVEAADQAYDLGHPLVPTHVWFVGMGSPQSSRPSPSQCRVAEQKISRCCRPSPQLLSHGLHSVASHSQPL